MFHNSYKESYVEKKKRRQVRKKMEIPGTSVLAVGQKQTARSPRVKRQGHSNENGMDTAPLAIDSSTVTQLDQDPAAPIKAPASRDKKIVKTRVHTNDAIQNNLSKKLGGGISIHTWADHTHKSMVFALGKDNNLNMRRSEVPGTSRIRISKVRRSGNERGTSSVFRSGASHSKGHL